MNTVVNFAKYKDAQDKQGKLDSPRFTIYSTIWLEPGDGETMTKTLPGDMWDDFVDYMELVETYDKLGSTGIMVFYKQFTKYIKGDTKMVDIIFDARTEIENIMKEYQTKFIEAGYFKADEFRRPWKFSPNVNISKN